jgi:hypothetical protein
MPGSSHLKDWIARELFRAVSMTELKSLHELMSDAARDHEFGATVKVIWRDCAGHSSIAPRLGWQRKARSRISVRAPGAAWSRRLSTVKYGRWSP